MIVALSQLKPSLSLISVNAAKANTRSYVEDGIAILSVQANGTISGCNQSASELLSCDASSLTWQHVSTFFPQLTETALLVDEKINPNLRFLSRIGYHFEVVAMNGMRFASKLFFVDIDHLGEHYLRLIIRPISQECVAS